MAAGLATLLEVLLVVVLRRVEGGRGRDLSDNRLPARILPRQERGRRRRLLGGIGKEDGGTVLGAQVPTLTVQCCRVVVGPKDVQKLLIADFGRVEVDLHGLRMAGAPRADLPVRRILGRSTGIANRGG